MCGLVENIFPRSASVGTIQRITHLAFYMIRTVTNTASVLLVLAALAFVPFAFSSAEEVAVESLQARIAELEAEVEDLKDKLAVARGEVEEVKSELELTRNLYVGMEGEDVKRLQEWLAAQTDIYPEGIVSGYYGALTEQAVKRWQKKYGIEQAGVVGPQTRAKIRVVLEGDDELPYGLRKKVEIEVEDDDDSDDDDSDDDDLYTITGKGKAKVCHDGESIEVSVAALMAHIRHGDTAGECADDSDEDEEEESEEDDEEEDEEDDDTEEEEEEGDGEDDDDDPEAQS